MLDKVTNVDFPMCRKILPLVYDDSLSYYEQLCGFVGKLNEVIDFANSLTDEILKEAKEYTDARIAEAFAEVDRKIAELQELIRVTTESFELLVQQTVQTFNDLLNDLQLQYSRFTQYVEGRLTDQDRAIQTVNDRLDASVVALTNQIDLKIELNNEYLLEEVTEHLPEQMKVYNILEGGKVTLQEMFDYLCSLHITDGIDVNTLVSRALDCDRIVTINRTVRDCVMYGNTILVP